MADSRTAETFRNKRDEEARSTLGLLSARLPRTKRLKIGRRPSRMAGFKSYVVLLQSDQDGSGCGLLLSAG